MEGVVVYFVDGIWFFVGMVVGCCIWVIGDVVFFYVGVVLYFVV